MCPSVGVFCISCKVEPVKCDTSSDGKDVSVEHSFVYRDYVDRRNPGFGRFHCMGMRAVLAT